MVKQAAQEIKSNTGEGANPLIIAKGLIVSYIVTIPSFILFALILANTDFPEKYMTLAVLVTTILSVFAAGVTVSRNARSKGWLNGSIAGIAYMLVLYLISSITKGDFSINRYVVTMLLVGILSGAIGGITGINLKNASKARHRR
ncbi:MAG: TIGR04086 family membrane protein [Clostridia bacterium]|nr:TIGR04086 family membrane protein [Clostridia bacterium]